MVIDLKRIYPDSIIPRYQTAGSAGLDLHAYKKGMLLPGWRLKVFTGIAISLPLGYEAQIRPRSSLSLKGIVCSFGTIDSDYRGEICVVLFNGSNSAFRWTKGERIAQLVINKIQRIEFQEVTDLDSTNRGTGGFGHTGRK